MKKSVLAAALCLLALSCQKEESKIVTELGCDCINKNFNEPYIVGSTINFSYAMYMPKGSGRIAEASA